MNQSTNIAFFGTSEFAVTIFDELRKNGTLPALIVTTPDRKQGRHLKLTPPPVKVWAESQGLGVLQPEILDDSLVVTLKETDVDLFIVASYGKIIPKKILDCPKKGALNVHPSLLPKFRGATPIESAILADDKETGVTIMLLDEKMDHGPILKQEKVTFKEWPEALEIEERLAKLGAHMLVEILPEWIKGKIQPVEQDHTSATFTKKIEKKDGEINLTDDAYLNFRKIQAYQGWPTAYFFTDVGGKKIRVIIKKARFENGNLIIETVLPEGKKEISYKNFQNTLPS